MASLTAFDPTDSRQPAELVSATVHFPVLEQEVLRFLAPRPGALYIDATAGGGGHSLAILKASTPIDAPPFSASLSADGEPGGSLGAIPAGRVLSLDADPAAVERVRRRLQVLRRALDRGTFQLPPSWRWSRGSTVFRPWMVFSWIWACPAISWRMPGKASPC